MGPPKETNPAAISDAVLDTLSFVVNQAGFFQGANSPPNPATFGKADTGPFGVAAHNQIKDAITAARGQSLPHADRLVEGVRIDGATGVVKDINVGPGGMTGDLNFDVVILREGETLQRGDKLQNKAILTGDAKFSGSKKNALQAAFAERFELWHLNLQAGNFKAQISMRGRMRELGIKGQGGFATIDGIGFIAIATSAGIVLTSEHRLQALVDLAKESAGDFAVGAALGKLAKSATMGGLLTMVVGLESDNPKHNERVARKRMIDEFIFDTTDGVVSGHRYELGPLHTEWIYEVRDAARYSDLVARIEYLLDNPVDLAEGKEDSVEDAAEVTIEWGEIDQSEQPALSDDPYESEQSLIPDGVDLSDEKAVEAWQSGRSEPYESEQSLIPDGVDLSDEKAVEAWQSGVSTRPDDAVGAAQSGSGSDGNTTSPQGEGSSNGPGDSNTEEDAETAEAEQQDRSEDGPGGSGSSSGQDGVMVPNPTGIDSTTGLQQRDNWVELLPEDTHTDAAPAPQPSVTAPLIPDAGDDSAGPQGDSGPGPAGYSQDPASTDPLVPDGDRESEEDERSDESKHPTSQAGDEQRSDSDDGYDQQQVQYDQQEVQYDTDVPDQPQVPPQVLGGS